MGGDINAIQISPPKPEKFHLRIYFRPLKNWFSVIANCKLRRIPSLPIFLVLGDACSHIEWENCFFRSCGTFLFCGVFRPVVGRQGSKLRNAIALKNTQKCNLHMIYLELEDSHYVDDMHVCWSCFITK